MMYPVAFLLFCPIISKKLRARGRKNYIMLGLTLISLWTLLEAILPKVPVDLYWLFMAIFCLLRVLQGISAAMIVPACYSIIVIQFHEDSEHYIGLANSASVLGLILGPFFGLTFNLLKPYLAVYVGYALIFIVLAVVCMIWIPNSVNKSDIREIKTRFDSRYSF